MEVVRCPVIGLGVAVAAAVGFAASLLRVSAAPLLDPTFLSPAFETGQFSITQPARLVVQTQVQPPCPQANLSVRGNYGERWVLCSMPRHSKPPARPGPTFWRSPIGSPVVSKL
jgi:hypothetical protein